MLTKSFLALSTMGRPPARIWSARSRSRPFITPGPDRHDPGPMTSPMSNCSARSSQIYRKATFEEAIAEANDTRFGLSASLRQPEAAPLRPVLGEHPRRRHQLEPPDQRRLVLERRSAASASRATTAPAPITPRIIAPIRWSRRNPNRPAPHHRPRACATPDQNPPPPKEGFGGWTAPPTLAIAPRCLSPPRS